MTPSHATKIVALFVASLACAAPGWADEPSNCPVRVDANFQWRVNVNTGCAQYHLGPWYSYFPYEAHFNMVAPYGGHAWLQQQSMCAGQPFPNGHTSTLVNQANQPAALNLGQPSATSLHYGPAPSYWYINR